MAAPEGDDDAPASAPAGLDVLAGCCGVPIDGSLGEGVVRADSVADGVGVCAKAGDASKMDRTGTMVRI